MGYTCFCALRLATVEDLAAHDPKEGHRLLCSCGAIFGHHGSLKAQQDRDAHSEGKAFIEHPGLRSGSFGDTPLSKTMPCLRCNTTAFRTTRELHEQILFGHQPGRPWLVFDFLIGWCRSCNRGFPSQRSFYQHVVAKAHVPHPYPRCPTEMPEFFPVASLGVDVGLAPLRCPNTAHCSEAFTAARELGLHLRHGACSSSLESVAKRALLETPRPSVEASTARTRSTATDSETIDHGDVSKQPSKSILRKHDISFPDSSTIAVAALGAAERGAAIGNGAINGYGG